MTSSEPRESIWHASQQQREAEGPIVIRQRAGHTFWPEAAQISSNWRRRQAWGGREEAGVRGGGPAQCRERTAVKLDQVRKVIEPQRTLCWEQPQRQNTQAGLGSQRNVEEKGPGFVPSYVTMFRLLRCSDPQFSPLLEGHNQTHCCRTVTRFR